MTDKNGIEIYIRNYPDVKHIYITSKEIKHIEESPALEVESIMRKYDELSLYCLNELGLTNREVLIK